MKLDQAARSLFLKEFAQAFILSIPTSSFWAVSSGSAIPV